MSMLKSLQGSIFFFFVILLLAVQAVFLRTIYDATRQQEVQQVEYQLSTANTVFSTQFESRRYYLAAFAETAAKDFGLKQVFREDTRSFLVALNNHRQRINADLAIAISSDGIINAQLVNQEGLGTKVSVGPEQGQPFRFADWLHLPDDSHLYPLQQHYYQISLAPLKSGSLIIGWVGFGYRIDAELARYFAGLTGLITNFVIADGAQWRLLASSKTLITDKELRAENQLINNIMQEQTPRAFIATVERIGEADSQNLAAIIYGNRADLLAAIRSHWWELGLLAALTLCLSLAGAYVIAARITRPVRELVSQAKHIAGGNYEFDVGVDTSGELGELAQEFKHMQQAVLSREQVISHQAFHEPLTDLPNRNRLQQVLEAWTANPEQPFSVVQLSVQHVADINSSLGHSIGDLVIKEVAQRLRCVASPDTLFHLGGSLFVILNNHLESRQTDIYVRSLLLAMEKEYRFENLSLYIEVRLGVAHFPQQERSAEGLIQKAAIALQYAKTARLPYKVYDELLSNDAMERLQLINELKLGIEANQLVLFYQPKLDLINNCVKNVEALVRWNHPQRGLVPPDKFIPIAEQTGLINVLTTWVVQEALSQHKRWLTQGIMMPIAINISAENLKDEGFYRMIMDSLREADVGNEALVLEITESAVVDDPKAAIAVLSRFDAQGITMSVDDYGTGYSSLAQLKQLPVHELKIDKSFVMKLAQNQDDQIIVHSTIELAHNMGLCVVAEGVEDNDSLNWLREHGCNLGQGYHICRPLPANEFSSWLQQSVYFRSTIGSMR